jgi:AraC family transcriptional regulator
MSLKRWVIGSGEVACFRDEREFREMSQDQAVLLMSEGRPTLAWNCWVPASLWAPVRGTARLGGRDLRLDLAADEVYVAEHGSRLSVQAPNSQTASLLGVLLPPDRVRMIARRELGKVLDEPLLFPTVIRHDPALQIPLLRLAHSVLRDNDEAHNGDALLDELIVQVVRRQGELDAFIERCPGRSPRYRRQVFMRLTRARNHIELAIGADASLNTLAEVAKMSPTHFLRLYRDVFGQTPHRHVVHTRLLAARELLMRTERGVADICRTLGFENRCAFARVFKQHFGLAPTAMRAQGQSRRSASITVAAPPSSSIASSI